jgi:hypothetical protein
MVLWAMAALGASPARLAAYADHYTRVHVVPAVPPGGAGLPDAPFPAALGDRTREADWRAYFAAAIARTGTTATIREAMPHLAPGVAASATHGLMRLAYGVLRDDRTEIANALGYWAATWLPLPAPEGSRSPADPVALLMSMQAEPSFRGITVPSTLLWRWIAHMGTLSAFRERLGRLPEAEDALPEMRRASLALYAGTMSFEALHALTGCHWLRLVAPTLDPAQSAALSARFWEVVMALYTRIGMPELPDAATLDRWRSIPVPPDAAIRAAAVASDDEHDHSLVFSAFEEFRLTGDPLYRVVAARRVGLI